MAQTRAMIATAAVTLVVLGCGGPRTSESPLAAVPEVSVPSPVVPTPACTVSGVVRESPGGAPSAGASVDIVKEPGGYSAPVIWSTTTDARGSYGIGGIDCGISRIVRIQKTDFFPAEISVLFDGQLRKDFTIDRITYLLRGIIRDAASRTPIPNATVEILSGPYAGRRDTSHIDGSYGLSARDTVTVRVSKAGYQSQDATATVDAPAASRDFLLTTR
jgi:hypothetical protein